MRKNAGITTFALALAVLPVQADDRAREVVPEVNAFIMLTDTTRLYLSGSLTTNTKENATDGELGVHLDLTLKPILRPELRGANWERNRYLWVRLGYEHSDGVDGRDDATRERRLMAELTGRVELPMEVWLVNRLRLDLRDLNGESAQRYRLRFGLEREFTVAGVLMVPYAQAETLYDTRSNSWNRQIYQAGAEIELSKQWRIEPYVARQNDKRSASANLNRVGVVLKYYR